MDAPVESEIIMSRRTARALRARGGNLYIWADEARTPQAQTTPPAGEMEFDVSSGDGWSVHIDSGIEPPLAWLVQWRRLPRQVFTAIYEPGRGSVSVLDAVPDAAVGAAVGRLFDWL